MKLRMLIGSMTRLKKLAIAMTVAVGSLAVVPTASALPASQCETHARLRDMYVSTGIAFYSIANYQAANYWFAKAAFQDAALAAGC